MIKQILLSTLGSLGFGFIFNIKGKKLIFASLGGGLGWGIYNLLTRLNTSVLFAMFCASIAISIYCEIAARLLKSPVTTFIIVSLIPLVPGSGMYYTMYETIQGNTSKAIHTGISTLACAGTLAIGIILVSSITRQITKRKL